MAGDASPDIGPLWKPPREGHSAAHVRGLRGGGRQARRAALMMSPSGFRRAPLVMAWVVS
jgi:hypothetical protein